MLKRTSRHVNTQLQLMRLFEDWSHDVHVAALLQLHVSHAMQYATVDHIVIQSEPKRIIIVQCEPDNEHVDLNPIGEAWKENTEEKEKLLDSNKEKENEMKEGEVGENKEDGSGIEDDYELSKVLLLVFPREDMGSDSNAISADDVHLYRYIPSSIPPLLGDQTLWNSVQCDEIITICDGVVSQHLRSFVATSELRN